MFPAEAPRSASDPRAAKPISALASLGVATLTGVAVFAVGVYIAERRWPVARTRDPAPHATSAAPQRPPPTYAAATEAPAQPIAPAAAPTIASAPAIASAPIIASAPETPAAAPAEGASAPGARAAGFPLSPGYGSLKIVSGAEATVYVNGVAAGATHQPLAVRCGRFFVRLGAPSPQGTRWAGPGKTVVIPCGSAIEAIF